MRASLTPITYLHIMKGSAQCASCPASGISTQSKELPYDRADRVQSCSAQLDIARYKLLQVVPGCGLQPDVTVLLKFLCTQSEDSREKAIVPIRLPVCVPVRQT